MEPRQGAPRLPYEGMPGNRGEAQPLPVNTGEYYYDGRHEVAVEQVPRPESEGLPPVIPTVPTVIPVVQDDTAQPLVSASSSAGPAVAADEDLIEKEWVDKAKKILEETKEDPYRRELEIGKLQRDYIRKRYGREIGESGD